MIIYENGIVVGQIDDTTFELTESTSVKLTGLVTSMVSKGIEFLQSQPEPLQEGQASGDGLAVMTADNEFFIDALETKLLIAGFEVQTA